jgi:hypothetical protein
MVAVSPVDASFLLTSIHERGLFVSGDGGVSWRQISSGLESNGSHHRVVFDPTNARIAYTTDTFSGVYRSTDAGLTWLQINTGLDMRAATGLAVSADGQHVYVGTNGAGVYRLDLNGQPPVPVSQPEVAETEPPAPSTPAVPGTVTPSAAPAGASGRSAANWLYLGLGVAALVLIALAFVLGRRSRS